jgi:poly(A) polymerase
MTHIAPDWLTAPATKAVMLALHDLSPHFVGGCVRDALIGREGGDIDIAVASPPQNVIALAETAGLGAHPTGLEHGVVTVTKDGAAFEVASLRRDVATDGRRAVVAFTTDMADDAARRDFTMNALYATAEGKVIDPLGTGITDLRAGLIRFIGSPVERIREDYLRILRYFRFHAVFDITVFEPAGLNACLAQAPGLAQISRERVGDEILKLLSARDPLPALIAMGPILRQVLPGAELPERLIEAEAQLGVAPDALRRLAALGAAPSVVAEHLRLSRKEQNYLSAFREAAGSDATLAFLSWRYGKDIARDCAVMRVAKGAAVPPDWTAEIARGQAAVLPITASDLIEAGIAPGPELGAILSRLEAEWATSDFTLDHEALLILVPVLADGAESSAP